MHQTETKLPPPCDLGMPAKFGAWRRNQPEALLYPIESGKRFVLQSMPTGFGKSVTYLTRAMLTGRRTCILTATKGLQDQLMSDAEAAGLTDIRGQGSYPCIALQRGEFGDAVRAGCDEGPCHHGASCKHRNSGCLYFDAYRKAMKSRLVVTNPAYWMRINEHNPDGIGDFEELIIDEAHEVVEALASFLAVEVERFEVEGILKSHMPTGSMRDWRGWAAVQLPKATAIYDDLKQEYKDIAEGGGKPPHSMRREIHTVSSLVRRLKRIGSLEGKWLVVPSKSKTMLKPVWPAPYAESALFCGIANINLVSATIRPKTAELLGISDYDFREYPSSFPSERRPVYHIPTIKLVHTTTAEARQPWIDRIDEIASSRLDRKGIIHTVSFARAKEILERCALSDIMVLNATGNTACTVEKFRQADAPKIMLSPSLTTGWDFPYNACEYIVIAKIPFPDVSDPITAARSKSDVDYAPYITMQTLVQECGRGMRAADDRCEIFIIDDNARWFIPKYRKFAPDWFLNSVRWRRTVPAPPPPLVSRSLLAPTGSV